MKTPEERGPLGAWAYDSRDRLGLSVEQVALALPKRLNPATIRKAEANSEDMSRPLWRALTTYYRAVASERGITLDAIPSYGEPEPVVTGDSQALIAAMTQALLAQTQALTDIRVELSEMRATMTTARNAALSERQAQMKVLASLGDALDELLARGDTGARAAGPVSGR